AYPTFSSPASTCFNGPNGCCASACTWISLVVPTAEDRKEEEEHIEDVEEDRRREEGCRPDVLGAAQPLEVEQDEPGEDRETHNGVDNRTAGDLHEHQHDPERDQPDQRPEQEAREHREVTPGGVAGSAEPCDEQCRRSSRLPDRLGIRADVVGDGRADGEPEQEPEGEEEPDAHLLRSLGRRVHPPQHREGEHVEEDRPPARCVAADIGSEREAAGRERDEAQRLTEQSVLIVAAERYGRGRGGRCHHHRSPMPPRAARSGGSAPQRSDRKAARSSSEKSCGSSQAAKCPPLSTSLKYVTFGYAFSAQLRGVRQISPGNVVKPNGNVIGGGAWPAALAWACPLSQYDRAAEAPVPVSQYSMMLSRTLSRVRLPVGCLWTNASEIFR